MDPMKCNTILSVSDDEKVSALKVFVFMFILHCPQGNTE